jgi:hypothetical protein
MELTRDQLRQLAREAYGMGASASTDEQRGYARGVEDLARYLTEGSASGAIDRLLSWTDFKLSMPVR